MMKKYKCEICGEEEKSQVALDVRHRGCRLSTIFKRDKKLEKKLGLEGSGMVAFDITKFKDTKIGKAVKKALKERREAK